MPGRSCPGATTKRAPASPWTSASTSAGTSTRCIHPSVPHSQRTSWLRVTRPKRSLTARIRALTSRNSIFFEQREELWTRQLKGSIVSAAEGDAEAARRAREIGELVLAQHRA